MYLGYIALEIQFSNLAKLEDFSQIFDQFLTLLTHSALLLTTWLMNTPRSRLLQQLTLESKFAESGGRVVESRVGNKSCRKLLSM